MRIGMIGLKGHQNVVLKGAAQLGDCQVVAVSDDDQGAVQSLRRKDRLVRGAKEYTGWQHLIDHTEMDVCCLCDENGIRAEQLIALAERNIHIVTEKPLTTTLDDLERVRQALAKSESRLTMLLTMRHEAKYNTMRKLIQDGAIGEVCQATSQKSYRLEERDEWQKHRDRLGGIIPYIGIHATDMMRWLTGLDYTHLAAFHGNNGSPMLKETEDQASVLLRMSNGASATARLDYRRPESAPTHGDDRVRIAGSRGVIESAAHIKDVLLITEEHGTQEISAEPVENLFVGFANAVRSGKPHPISADDCLYITEVVLRARDAADQRQLVEMPAHRTLK